MGRRFESCRAHHFDASGNLLGYTSGYLPQMATAGGGVVAAPYSGLTALTGGLLPGPAATFDASLRTTGLTNLPTQSWLGNNYQVGSIEQTMVSAISPALSFGAFLMGNPSSAPSSTATSSGASSTAILLNVARAFVPYGLYNRPPCVIGGGCTPPIPDPKDKTWKRNFQQAFTPRQSVLDIRLYDRASLGQFLPLATVTTSDPMPPVITNDVVAYIGHGVTQPDAFRLIPPQPRQYGDPAVAMGFLFTDSQCLWFDDLIPQTPPGFPPNEFVCLGPAPVATVIQKPRIIFLGLCGATAKMAQDWALDQNNQVVIYPIYSDTLGELDIGLAAGEYQAFLADLVQGNSVSHALAAMNTKTQSDIAQSDPTVKVLPDGTEVDKSDPTYSTVNGTVIHLGWSWTSYGNANLKFKPVSQ